MNLDGLHQRISQDQLKDVISSSESYTILFR